MKYKEGFPSNQIERADLIDTAFEKADRTLVRDGIKVGEFRERYSEERIKAAETYEAECKKRFTTEDDPIQKQSRQLGRILEALVHENGEKNNWFGERAFTTKTADYDDYKHRVDEVVTLREEEGTARLALAVDVVSHVNVEAKFAGIFDEVSAGKLAKVEYFKEETFGDEEPDYIGELQNMPKIIIGVDASTITELAEPWVDGKNSLLAVHPIQFQLLEEILLQCQAFEKLATNRHHDMVAEKYRQAGTIIARVLEERRKAVKDTGRRDSVFEAIKAVTNRLLQE